MCVNEASERGSPWARLESRDTRNLLKEAEMVVQGERVAMPAVTPGPLAPLAETVAAALKGKGQTVAVFESTSGGLVQAALQAVPGASAYTTCGAVTYHSSKAVAVLGCDLSAPRPADAPGYVAAKQKLTAAIARRMRDETGADWCVSESGACGPSFNVPGISVGFTVITVSHRDIERSVSSGMLTCLSGRSSLRKIEQRLKKRVSNPLVCR